MKTTASKGIEGGPHKKEVNALQETSREGRDTPLPFLGMFLGS